jgi:C4-dicarboxylate transporter DctQ subunit
MWMDLTASRFSKAGVVICLSLILFLSFASILLRWMGNSAMWIDPFVRYMVLFIVFLGGSLAIDSNSHIGIDLLPRLLGRNSFVQARNIIKFIILAASGLVCLWLLWASWELAAVLYRDGGTTLFGWSEGTWAYVIPCGFLLLSFRFFLRLALEMMTEGKRA